MPPPFAVLAFLAGPRAFMDDNIIVPHHSAIGTDRASARIRKLTLSLGRATGKQTGRDIPVYVLRPWRDADPDEQAFFAYWCPYNQNETLACTLGNGARFMFTATMDGCSFGVGTQNGGACRVAHSNMGSHGGGLANSGLSVDAAREQQRLTQRNALWAELGSSTIDLIQPGDYMTDYDGQKALKSTTFGIHELGRPWQFYTQRFWKKGNTLFLRTVTDQI